MTPATHPIRFALLLFVLPWGALGCGGGNPAPPEAPAKKIELTSSAFKEGEAIPKPYTADGKGVSPLLRWGDPPQGTKSFALICDDPDAPGKTWVHWVIFNLPADLRGLDEATPTKETLANGARQGKNDSDDIGYGGPGPPPGKPHRYFFKLHALDAMLDLPAGATKDQLLAAMKGHILAEGQLMGTYARP
jgi:Raf kinase inhibitor-like YbhB/YbcL family protein